MRRLLPLVVAATLMTGCGGGLSPAERLKDMTAVMVEAANAGDLAGLKSAVLGLRSEVQAQEQGGTLTPNQATVLLKFLSQIERDAPLLTATPTPTATVTETPSPTPSSTPSPSPTPSPTASPTASPTPPPTTAPPATTLPSPTLGVDLGQGKPSATATASP